jgi:hypothetical protein
MPKCIYEFVNACQRTIVNLVRYTYDDKEDMFDWLATIRWRYSTYVAHVFRR